MTDHLPKYEFDKCVRSLSRQPSGAFAATYEQFLIMAFAQLTYRESLRDIETCLHALATKLYHSGSDLNPCCSVGDRNVADNPLHVAGL